MLIRALRGASGGACDGDDKKEGDHLTPGLTGRSFDGWQMDRVQVVEAGIWMRIEHLNTKRIFGVQLGVQI